MKSEDLNAVDAAAVPRPWSWCDGTYLWNEEADHGVLSHGGTRWPVSPENRAAIESAMNHMPALIALVSNLESRQTATCTRPGPAGCMHGYHVLGCDVQVADAAVSLALDLVHAVPSPRPSSPVTWDPDGGRPVNPDLAASAANASKLDLNELERLAGSSPLVGALIATIRELRAGLADALYWLKPGLASQEDRAEEMTRDRADLSKLLDKEIEIP